MQPKAGRKHHYGCSIESPQTTSEVQIVEVSATLHFDFDMQRAFHIRKRVWLQSGDCASVHKRHAQVNQNQWFQHPTLGPCFGHGVNLCPENTFCGTPPEAHERPRRLHAAPGTKIIGVDLAEVQSNFP